MGKDTKDRRAGGVGIFWLVPLSQGLIGMFLLGEGMSGKALLMFAAMGITLWLVVLASKSRWRVKGGHLLLAAVAGRPAMDLALTDVSGIERVTTVYPEAPDSRATFNLVLSSGSRILLGTQLIQDYRYGRAKLVAVTAQEMRSAVALAEALGLQITDR